MSLSRSNLVFNSSDSRKLCDMFVDSTFVLVRFYSKALFSKIFPDELPSYYNNYSSNFDKLVFNFY